MSKERELRKVLSPISIRSAAAGSDSPGTIEGMIHTYGSVADLHTFTEEVLPHAFDDAVNSGDDICCFFNHEPSNLLGRRSARTASYRATDDGLWFSCTLPNTQAGRDVYTLASRGDLQGCSWMFTVDPQDEKISAGGPRGTHRTIKRISQLFEGGPVSMPAYKNGSSVNARSLGIHYVAGSSDAAMRERARQLLVRIRESDNLLVHHEVEMNRALLEDLERRVNGEYSVRNTEPTLCELHVRLERLSEAVEKEKYDLAVKEWFDNRPRHSVVEKQEK